MRYFRLAGGGVFRFWHLRHKMFIMESYDSHTIRVAIDLAVSLGFARPVPKEKN